MCNSQGCCLDGVYEAFKQRLLKDGAAVCLNAATAAAFAERLARDGIKAERLAADGKRHEFRLAR
jgi:hypothetical protein